MTAQGTTTTVSPASATYGAGTTTLSATVSPATSGTVTFTVTSGSTTLGTATGAVNGSGQASALFTYPAGTSAGTYTVTASYAAGSGFGASSGTGLLTITKAVLTVTASNASRTYGAANPPFAATYSGFVNGETVSVLSNAPTLQTAAAASSPVGAYDITATVGSLSAANYSFVFVSGKLSVLRATLIVTAANAARAYGDANPTFSATYAGFVNSETLTTSGVTGDPSLTSAATTTSPVGAYVIVAAQGGLASGNYAFTFVDGNLTVGSAVLTVTANHVTRAYGAADPTFTYAITGYRNGDGSSVVTGVPTLTTTAAAASAPGDYAVNVDVGPLSAANYTFVAASGTMTVTKAVLTVTADDKTKTYGAGNPAFTATITGFAAGESLGHSDVTGAPSVSTTATNATPVGGYAITAAKDTLASTNYSFTFVQGTLNVGKAQLTVTADNKNVTYGQATPTLTASLTGFVLGEDASSAHISGNPSLSTSASNPPAAGTYPITVGVVDLSAANYSFTAGPAGTLTVGKAVVTVTATSDSRKYGSANPPLSATFSGFANGDTVASLGGAPGIQTTAGATSSVGDYAITVTTGTLSSANYSFAFANGTLTVTPAPLSVVVANGSKVYGTSNPSLGGTVTGVLNNDAITAAYSTTAGATSPAGGYPVTASLLDPNGRLGNYTVSITPGTLAVTKATLTVTADPQTKVYGDVNPTLTATFGGFVGTDGPGSSNITGSPLLATTATVTSGVGPYPITVDASHLESPNYTFTGVGGTLTVGRATLTVTAQNASRAYGSTNPTFSALITGYRNGDPTSVVTGAPAVTTAAVSDSAPSTYPITASQGTLAATNYSFVFVAGTLTVTKATLTVTAADASKVYGQANPSFSATLTGFANGETLSTSDVHGTPALTTPAATDSPVGGYAITPTVGSLTSSHYEFAYANGTLNIGKATLTVTADAKSKVYGSDNPGLTATISGFVLNQNLGSSGVSGAPWLSTGAVTTSGVGSYPITTAIGNLAADNYSFYLVNGALSVTPATLTVTADAATKVYGSANPTFGASYSGFVLGQSLATSDVTGPPSLTTTAGAGSPVGSYTIMAAQGELLSTNYVFVFVDGSLSVTRAPLSVVVDNQTKVYGSANPLLTGTLSGVVNADAITVTYSTPATDASGVGGYSITAGLNDPGFKLGNYTITNTPGTLTVTPKALTITADNVTTTYGSAPTFTVTPSGLVSGDTLASANFTGALAYNPAANAATSAGMYTITPSGLSSTNYAITYATGTWTVNKAALTITAANASKTYGDDNPTLSGTITGLQNGDAITASYGTEATNASAVGSYWIVPAAVDTTPAKLGNYAVTLVNGSLTINRAPLTITADNQNRVYGSANPTLTGKIVGIKNGDAVTASYSTGATSGSVVAAYPIVPAAVDSSPTRLGNYTVTLVNGTLNVTQKALTITANNVTSTYGEAPAFTVTPSGLVSGDTLASANFTGTLSYSPMADAGKPTGSYSITPSGLSSTNYAITYATGTWKVNAKALTIKAVDVTTTFGSAPTFGVAPSGLVPGDTLASPNFTGTLTFAPAADAAKPVGTYTITASGLASTNYVVTYAPGTWTVGKLATTTVVTTSAGPVQYSDRLTLTATVSPTLVASSQLSGSVKFTIAGEPDVSAPINASGVATAAVIVTGPVSVPSPANLAKAVSATFTSTNSNFAGSVGTTSAAEAKEGTALSYTGETLVSTGSTSTSSTKTVNLSAAITEEADQSLGTRLSEQYIKFSVTGTTQSCTAKVSIPTPYAGTGTAGCSVTLGENNYTVQIELVDNFYYAAPIEDAAVTVVLAGTGFTTGGGWVKEPTLGTKSNFGFTVKYLKNANIQGNSLYIYRKTLTANQAGNPAGGFLPAGDYNWIIKSNSMVGLSQSCPNPANYIGCTATFTGKSTITAVNRTTGVSYSLGGNNNFQVDVKDNGEPGASSATTPDTYTIRVWDSTGTYYQLGTPAAPLSLSGGNIQVRP